jgi:hypothetical protein
MGGGDGHYGKPLRPGDVMIGRGAHETVARGLEAAPAARISMLSGDNIGKPVARLAAATE